MTEQIQVMHIFRARDRTVRDQILTLIGHLSRRQYAVTVAGELDDYSKRRLAQYKARWVQMPLPADMSPLGQMRTARRLARLVVTQKTTLVHTHGFQAAFTALMGRRRLRDGPAVVCSPYGLPGVSHRPNLHRRSVIAAARWVLRSSDLIVTQSKHEARQLEGLAGGSLANLRNVPEGVVLERLREDFEAGAKRRLVGLDPMAAIVGVMVPPGGRGILSFLQAARAIIGPRPNVEFLLVGEDAKSAHYAQAAHELGLSGCTVFLGQRSDIVEIVASLNVLVIPGDYIGARHHAVHALASGIPLIVADDGDLADLASGLTSARTVPCDDPKNLEAAIAHFVDAVPSGDGSGLVDDELGFSDSELLVSGMVIDLDTFGLEPVPGRPLTAEQAAVQRVVERYSMSSAVRVLTELYDEAITVRQRRITQ